MKSCQLSSGSFGGSLDLLKALNVPGTSFLYLQCRYLLVGSSLKPSSISFLWVVMANSVDLVVHLARTGSSHGMHKDISCGHSMNGQMTDRSLLYDTTCENRWCM